ncbi:hypothetical protein ACGRHY_29975 [Streptomyces sp. HK10]|uniref:hypothetical protein n=1 Tax=Streptomyces sp. HK10 TaxID=3373255 RepID=UPI00374A4602
MAKGLFRRVAEKLFPSRQAPVKTTTQATHVRDRKYGGSTRRMAQAYGRSQRSIERWIKGDRIPRGKDAAKLESEAAAVQVTDRGRERKARQMEKAPQAPAGLTLRVVLHGGEASVSGSDVVRHGSRTITAPLTNEQAAAFVRSGDTRDLNDAVTGALADYFGVQPGDLSHSGDYDVDLL